MYPSHFQVYNIAFQALSFDVCSEIPAWASSELKDESSKRVESGWLKG
jgi:hypothetical protein